jgi:putative endonuclease
VDGRDLRASRACLRQAGPASGVTLMRACADRPAIATFTSMKGGWVYIMTNKHNTTLYTGVTSNIMKRVLQHKKGVFPESFTDQFLCHKLVWFEFVPTIEGAIAQEKRMKRWRRAWKEELIAKANPEWKDLSEDWYHAKDFE